MPNAHAWFAALTSAATLAVLGLLPPLSTSSCSSSSAAPGAKPGDAAPQTDAPGSDGGTAFTLSLGDPSVVSTYAQRAALGFKFGYVDGVLGAVNQGGTYTFFVSGHTVA